MGIFDMNPLADLGYNSGDDRGSGEKGAEAGYKYFRRMVPPQYQDVKYTGPQSAGDVRYQGVGDTAYSDIDPRYQEAQNAQRDALASLARNGGMNSADAANLQQIQNQTNQNAAAQRQAVLQQAQMRGAGTGGNAILAQLMANQNAANQNNQGGLQVAGMAQNRALQAGEGASNIAAQQQQQAAQRAAAQDAIAKFNAQNTLQTALYNNQREQGINNLNSQAQNQNQYMNKFMLPSTKYNQQIQVGKGLSGAGRGMADYYTGQQKMRGQGQGQILGGMAQLGMKAWPMIAGMFSGGGAEGGAMWAGGDLAGGAAAGEGATAAEIGAAGASGGMMASHGGKIPGQAKIPGDSLKNDTVPVMASPGEVIVPKTLATHGTDDQISQFVKHAPSATTPDKNREAMLSALKHIRSRGGR